MKSGSLIVFSPGFRRIWKFRFDGMALSLLLFVCTLAAAVMGSVVYVPLLAADDPRTYRLVVENGTTLIENKTVQSRVGQMLVRAKALEEETSRISAELQEQVGE